MIKMNPDLANVVSMMGDENKILTPRYVEWLLANPDVVYDEWVVQRIMAEMRKVPRVRSGTFSASSAGVCGRAQVYGYQGQQGKAETDLQLINMGNDGKWRHLRYQANMLQAGLLEDIELTLPWPAMRSMGSIDGVTTVPDDHPRVEWRGQHAGVELKGAYSFKAVKIATQGPQVYREQVIRYCLSGGFRLFSILVENRDSLEFNEYVYEVTDDELAESAEQLKRLNDAVDLQTIPDRLPACASLKGETFNRCRFGGKHGVCATQTSWPT